MDAETPVAVADDAFGTDLYLLLTERAGDTVFSPASVAAALRLALCGARGETARELAAALHLDVAPDGPPDGAADAAAGGPGQSNAAAGGPGQSNAAAGGPGQSSAAAGGPGQSSAAVAGLCSLSSLVSEISAADSTTFRVANTVWMQTGLPLSPGFTARLRGSDLAEFEDADFAGAHEAARAQINRVIEAQTAGKITGLLAPGSVDQLTRLVLANALYLKAPWADQFPEAETRDAPFYVGGPGGVSVPGGERLTVPMMHGTATRAYARGDGYQAVLLSYANSRLAMAIVLPDGSLDDLRPLLADGGVRGLLDETSSRRVTLSMPRFRLETGSDLIPVLRRRGVNQAFGNAADFSGMTSAKQLRIDAVAHKAYIDVDEHGTEAAAATAVTMRLLALSQPPPHVEMVVDRPFMFAIIDTPTRLPLFLGQVSHPHRSR